MKNLQKTAGDLARHVGGEVRGDGGLVITGAATLGEAGFGDVSFLANPKYEKDFRESKASVVVVGKDVECSDKTLICCDDPYYSFMQIVVLLHGHREHRKIGISGRASVDESALIGKNVDIHDFTCVSEGATIGDNTRIYPNCTIGPGSKVGRDCIIYPNVTIYDGCSIGDRVTIHSGSVIGQDGFGYATHGGKHHKIPQIGGVVIEDDVEIGANCTIDRGTLGDTVIGKGSKFSNLIAIGHNTRIGEHCLLVAQVGIAGSTTIGKYCTFAGQVGVVGHIKIGDFVRAGGQSGIMHDLPDKLEVVGSPAMPITQTKRSLLALKDLPDLRKKVRNLERQIERLLDKQEAEE